MIPLILSSIVLAIAPPTKLSAPSRSHVQIAVDHDLEMVRRFTIFPWRNIADPKSVWIIAKSKIDPTYVPVMFSMKRNPRKKNAWILEDVNHTGYTGIMSRIFFSGYYSLQKGVAKDNLFLPPVAKVQVTQGIRFYPSFEDNKLFLASVNLRKSHGILVHCPFDEKIGFFKNVVAFELETKPYIDDLFLKHKHLCRSYKFWQKTGYLDEPKINQFAESVVKSRNPILISKLLFDLRGTKFRSYAESLSLSHLKTETRTFAISLIVYGLLWQENGPPGELAQKLADIFRNGELEAQIAALVGVNSGLFSDEQIEPILAFQREVLDRAKAERSGRFEYLKALSASGFPLSSLR